VRLPADAPVSDGAPWLPRLVASLTLAPARVHWLAWPRAFFQSVPPLLVSLFFAGRLAEWPGLEGLTFRLAGLVLIGGCLAATVLARWLNWPGQLAALSTGVTLGLVVPALALYLPLAQRAVADPAPVVMAPALAGLGLLAAMIGVVVGCVLLCRPAAALAGPSLLPAASLAVWPIPLVWRPEETVVWVALAVTFAVAAVAWFAAGLVGGWPIVLPPSCGLVATGSIALSVPVGGTVHARADGLLSAQVALALAAGLLAVLLPAALAWWPAWRVRAAGARPRPGEAC
jgi:hypothetical protein